MPSIHEVEFSRQIARGAVFGPTFKTTVVTSDSGFEQRNADWAKDRAQGNIGTGIKDRDGMSEVITFFRARRGKLYGFRYFDWADYEATLQLLIASAVGGETEAQLVKTYSDAGGSYVRTIYKPITSWTSPGSAGTLQLFLNGSLTPLGGVSIDTVTGIATFPALSPGDSLRWTGRFNVPVRFDTDNLQLAVRQYDSGDVPDIPIVELRLDDDGQG